MISFSNIPADIKTPGSFVEVDDSNALAGLPLMPHRILLIGQGASGATATAGQATLVLTAEKAITLFGAGSQLAHMFERLKAVNPNTETWGLMVAAAPGAVAAVHRIEFAGAFDTVGSYYLYIGGRRLVLTVEEGETKESFATKVAAAVNDATDLPVTAGVVGGNTDAVDLTVKWAGASGNDIELRANYFAGEVNPVNVTETISRPTSGATNPDITAGLTAVQGEHWHTIVMAYVDAGNLAALEAELARRFGPMVQEEGHGFAAFRGTAEDAITLGGSRNSPHVTILATDLSPTPPWEWAASVAGRDAGEPDPARPRQTLALLGCLPRPRAQGYARGTRDLLLNAGISTVTVDLDGTARIERLVTTYDSASLFDVTTLRTLAYLRYSLRERVKAKWPRHKLASDGTRFAPGQAIVTPSVVKAEILALAREWESAGLVEDVEGFKQNLRVERNGSDPSRLDALVPPDVVNGLVVFAVSLRFVL